jgi:hypothetical protein
MAAVQAITTPIDEMPNQLHITLVYLFEVLWEEKVKADLDCDLGVETCSGWRESNW